MVGTGTLIFALRAGFRAGLAEDAFLTTDVLLVVFLAGAFFVFFGAARFAFLTDLLARLATTFFAFFRFVLLTIVISPLLTKRVTLVGLAAQTKLEMGGTEMPENATKHVRRIVYLYENTLLSSESVRGFNCLWWQ